VTEQIPAIERRGTSESSRMCAARIGAQAVSACLPIQHLPRTSCGIRNLDSRDNPRTLATSDVGWRLDMCESRHSCCRRSPRAAVLPLMTSPECRLRFPLLAECERGSDCGSEKRAERFRATARFRIDSLIRPSADAHLPPLIDCAALQALSDGRALSVLFSNSHAHSAAPVQWSIAGTAIRCTADEAQASATEFAAELRRILSSHPLAPGTSGQLDAEPAIDEGEESSTVTQAVVRPATLVLNVPSERHTIGFAPFATHDSSATFVAIPYPTPAEPRLDRVLTLVSQRAERLTVAVSAEPITLSSHQQTVVRRLLERLERGLDVDCRLENETVTIHRELADHVVRLLRPWALDRRGWGRDVIVTFASGRDEHLLNMCAEELFGAPQGSTEPGAAALDFSRLVHASKLGVLPMPAPHHLRTCGVRMIPRPPEAMPAGGIKIGHLISGSRAVFITPADLDRHLLMVGATGTGKSVLMRQIARDIMRRGEGLCLIDPHGDLYRDVLTDVPLGRAEDVRCIVPGHPSRSIGLNLLEVRSTDPEAELSRATNELVQILDALFDLHITGGPMFDSYLRHAVHLVGHNVEPGTLVSVVRIFEDDRYRSHLLETCKSPHVVAFWKGIAERAMGDSSLRSMAPYVVSKLGRFTANPILRSMIGQPESTIDFARFVEEQRIVLVDLSIGSLGVLDARLIGMLIASKLYTALMQRRPPAGRRTPFTICIDETQHFATETLGQLLAESRKYGCRLVLSAQALTQLHSERQTRLRDTILGNVSSLVVFRPGVADAGLLEAYMQPELKTQDLLALPNFEAGVRLLGTHGPLRSFVVRTEAPRADRTDPRTAQIIVENFERYTRARSECDAVARTESE
jgi:hypothetical protein